MAFQHEIIAWAERAERTVVVPENGSPRLSLAELRRRFHEALPLARIASVQVSSDPAKAVLFRHGPVNVQPTTAYANPYTGEIKLLPRSTADRWMRALVEWHRWLGLSGTRRDLGKAITGAGTLLLIGAVSSGLYLWWPRRWSSGGLRNATLPKLRATGKRRLFNWHSVFGLWLSPLLLIIALTGLPIAYKWATALLYQAHGETEKPPVPLPPFKGTAKVDLDRIVVLASSDVIDWMYITINMPVGYNGNRANAGIRSERAWPRESLTALTFDPVTGEIVHRGGFQHASPGRRFWMWTRLLHTGEALGWPGKVTALVTAIGGLLLVYTGLSLALHRLVGRRG